METLSPEVREHLAHGSGHHDPYVVVFGRTQVGKTTLLLDLMGVHPNAQQRIGKVLRGGREAGKSATATAMEYRRSADQHWRIDTGSGIYPLDSDAAMCAALSELRLAMGERRLHSEAPVVVWIPDDCFAQPAGTGVGTRMLDLPGDSPADEVEREHVQRMAQRYVPYADLILLVGKADDLTFLNPESLTLPSIEDWQFVPNRFRIVTTYSFTPQSVQQFARSFSGKLAPEHFRKRLLEQIRSFNLALSPEAQETCRYFPLEFGDSWRDQAATDSEFVGRVNPILEQLKGELQDDIRNSSHEAARFRNALDVQIVARRKYEIRRKEGEAELHKIDEKISVSCTIAQQAMERERDAAGRYDAVCNLLDWRKIAEAELEGILKFDATEKAKAVDDLEETNTRALFGRINDFKSWLRQQFLENQPTSAGVKKFFGNSRPNLGAYIGKVNRIAEDEFEPLVSRMNDYWTDEYYPSVSDSFSNDKSRLKLDIRNAAVKVAALAQEVWSKQLKRRVEELETELVEAQSERTSMACIALERQAEQERLASLRMQVQMELGKALERLERDATTGKRFIIMLYQEYLLELQRRRALIAHARSPIAALLALVSVQDLADERHKVNPS
ncbi:MAG TPA: hypothetical protein VJ654_11255 [Noviherbaspirillum sp.]|nr:hypothetical protein [Noviherbaspirillum sp.]